MNKKTCIVASVILASFLMSYIDGIIAPSYICRSCIKILMFLGIPMLYLCIYKEDQSKVKTLFTFEKKYFLLSLGLGMSVFLIVMLGYVLFKNYIDFNSIVSSLTGGIGVNAANFLYVAIYISFINSLLEEIFFRGFSFMLLKETSSKVFAYVFSSALFSFYHVGMTIGWFHPLVYILALLGLFVGGCIFDCLNEKCNSIYPSWLVHMFANFAINTIGFMLFGLL